MLCRVALAPTTLRCTYYPDCRCPCPRAQRTKLHAVPPFSTATKALADITNTHKQSTRWANMTQGQEMLLAEAGKRIKPLELKPPPPLQQRNKGKPKAQPAPNHDIRSFGHIM